MIPSRLAFAVLATVCLATAAVDAVYQQQAWFM